MTDVQKIMLAIAGAFIAGFLLVGTSKQQTTEQMEAAATIRSVVAMQEMANQKCPTAIKNRTGSQVYFPSETDTDKETYVTLKWVGEKGDKFKTASCTLHASLGGISKLVIDDKVLIDKKP